MVGYVVGLKQKSRFPRLNPVLAVLDRDPVLTENALRLTKAFSAYYGCSWGEAVEAWLPAALRRKEPLDISFPAQMPSPEGALGGEILLHDKSADKRWAFLGEQIRQTLQGGCSVIFLVPETFLTAVVQPHLQEAVAADSLIVLDKTLTPKQELARWLQIRQYPQPLLILGTRSAVFAPAARLGLIIIYDEENPVYKQAQTPHYHVHETARMRSRIESCRVLYVSAAPSAEVWSSAGKKGLQKTTLEAQSLSDVQTVDMTNYGPRLGTILSFPLRDAIQKILERKGRCILWMNRKGFTTRTHCHQCSWTLKCPRCDVNLTYLYSQKKMVCRHCNFQADLPKICPNCRGGYLRSTGTGVEKLESEVARLYPQARVGRYDREIARFPQEADILIATQAVFRKRECFPADLIGVVNFDAELHHMDFRSAQRAFAFLVHLRQWAGEKLIIQTRMADNYCIEAVRRWDFDFFYRRELKHRRELGLPPYRHLLAVGLRGTREDMVFEQSRELFEKLDQRKSAGIEVSDPHPDVNPKLRDKYRFTIVLKGRAVKGILALARSVLKDFRRKAKTVVTINVDP